MTDEEVKKIAREYINRVLPVCAYPSVQIRDDFATDTREKAIEFLQWLSKDYCIVPKAEILNQHAWYMQRMKEVSSNRQMNRGKAIALENLFGKEMFEGGKK